MLTSDVIKARNVNAKRYHKGGGGGGGYQNVHISACNQVPILFVWCIVQYVYFIVLYMILCRKFYFLRYRQLAVGGVTMYDKG